MADRSPPAEAAAHPGRIAPPAQTTIYGLGQCDTVRRARHDLAATGTAHVFVDWRRNPPAADVIATWLTQCGPALVNPRSRNWKNLSDGQRRQLGEATPSEALSSLLRDDPTLMRRPLIWYPDGGIGLGWANGKPAEHHD